jgi:hypothetical protein
MSDGQYEIDEATFKKMSLKDQNWITFTTFNQYRKDTDKRIKTIENRKITDKGMAIGSGFVGGFIAILTKNIF